jgi:epoxyqueuosine reductase QueG
MFISSFGFKALALEGLIRKMNDKTLSTILPHKTSATLSGLGWIGKCNLLVTNEFGSGIRLSTVLTDMRLKVGEPRIQSKCGDCTICYQLCPAKAVTGKNWIQGMKREEIYDAYACKMKAKELSGRVGAKHTICGICITNCPWTLKYING